MRKKILVIFGVIFVIVILVFLFFVGFSKISTNKDIYEIGEEVVVSFSDFRLLRCTTGPNINFYYKTSDGWDKITHTDPITFGRPYCVDGKLASGAYPADIVSCCVLCKPFLSGEYIWKSQIYEKKDEKEICGDIPEPVISYRLRPVSPGKYKIEFGSAQKIFEIKGVMPLKLEIPEDETANWNTYRNEEYGFSFKYPEKIDLGKGSTQTVVKENLNPVDAMFVAYIEKPFTLGFKVLEKPQDFSDLEEYVRTETENINKTKGSAAPIHAEFDEFTIDDIRGFAIKTTAADVLGNTDIEIYFEKLDYLFIIRYGYSETLLGEQDSLESSKYNTIRKIISTFRFLE